LRGCELLFFLAFCALQITLFVSELQSFPDMPMWAYYVAVSLIPIAGVCCICIPIGCCACR
jgi:hypothetical protein